MLGHCVSHDLTLHLSVTWRLGATLKTTTLLHEINSTTTMSSPLSEEVVLCFPVCYRQLKQTDVVSYTLTCKPCIFSHVKPRLRSAVVHGRTDPRAHTSLQQLRC